MAAADPSKPLFVPRVLWAALYASTFIYLYVYLTAAPDRPTDGAIGTMRIALAGVAVVCAVLSFVLPAFLHRKGAQTAELDVKEVPDPNASVMFRDQTPTIRVFAKPAVARKKAMALYFTPLILSLALTEAIAIYGLVLGFMGAEPTTVLPFFVAAWILFLPRFPRWKAAAEPLEEAHDARFFDDGGSAAGTGRG